MNRLFEYLKSSGNGLAQAEAEERLRESGPNEIVAKERKGWLEVLLSQFKNALVLLLAMAAVISFFLGEKIDALVILAIVLLNSALGFVQEYRAERVLKELGKYVTLAALVRRNSGMVRINARDIVTGDIVYLKAGDVVPADIRLLEADNLTVDESTLTGESAPVTKHARITSEKHSLPQYLRNVAFMGTSLTSGSGYGIAIATGKNTFFGKTATYLRQGFESEFQKGIKRFSGFLLKVTLAMTAFIFASNAILGKGAFDSFLFAVALAVGITPEILPVIITIALSNGALKMAKKNVIIKRLSSVEDLGNIDMLCCDKTGTLTDGKFELQRYLNLDGRKDEKIALYGLLCNSADMAAVKRDELLTTPIDRALWESSLAKKLAHAVQGYRITGKNDFDFERKRMSTLVRGPGSGACGTIIAKGAHESMLRICRHANIGGKKEALTRQIAEKVRKQILEYEKDGYIVILVASRSTNKRRITKSDEKGLQLLGLLLFIDPPKKTAKASLKLLQRLGVAIKVISGDSPAVTRKICNDVGLKIAENRVIGGEELDRMGKKEFEAAVSSFNVFARVTPGQKYRIVATLNREGNIVGFLGDGVNDAPALKAADVGISVDSATGVAKEAADIILLQKSLSVLAEGIIEGRKTFGNITKYILNTISANYGNMFSVAAASLFMKFIPLLPSQILLNNFMSDVPMIAVSTDNVDKEFLKKPKRWNIKLISEFMVYFGLLSTVFDLAFLIPLMIILKASPELLRTAWFVESALSEIVVTFAIRTQYSFLKSRPGKWLVIASAISGLAVLILPFTKAGNLLFGFVPLPPGIIIFAAAIILAYFTFAEIAKKYFFSKFEA